MLATMTLYHSKRRTPTKTEARKEPRVITHLRGLLDQVQAMTEEERRDVSRRQWIPPEQCIALMLDPALKQCDRVEIIMVYYKFDNGGANPPWDTVGGVLGISHKNARQYARDLLKGPNPRADDVRGHIVLRRGRYLHVLIKRWTS